MKKTSLLLLLFCVCFSINATHCPEQWDKIAFLPVIDEIKAELSGFDCFYYTSKVYKNGKFSFKDKYRLNANTEVLTPYNDIEGHTFLVLAIEHYVAQAPQKDVSTVFLLRREDGIGVSLRVPHSQTPSYECNVLTKAMEGLSIPYYNIQDFKFRKLVGTIN